MLCRGLELNPRYESAWSNKGNALRELGRLEESLACYDRALKIDPSFGGVVHCQSSALADRRKWPVCKPETEGEETFKL